jgi:hypothetical protein
MSVVIGAISIFGLGYALCAITGLPALPVICACLVLQLAVLLMNGRTKKNVNKK